MLAAGGVPFRLAPAQNALDFTALLRHFLPMALQLEAITKEARGWPRAQRLALARVLLEPEANSGSPVAEAAWEEEIRARVLAVEEDRTVGVPYEEVRQQMQARFAP